MINDHTSPPERFKFTTPYPFKFTVRKESRSRCESLHSSKDGECFTDNLENLKQFRALPMPGRTFLLSDQFKNQSRRNSVFDEFRASSCDRKKHQSVYSSALSEVPFQTSSTPDLSRLSLQRDTPKSDAKFNFKPTSSPKTRNAQPFAEFLAEQEVMREIRVKHRANQLLKTSRLPFSGSHWQCQRKKCEITDEQHLSRKLQKRISNNSKPVVQPKIRSPRCKFRDVIDNQIKSNVNSDSKKSATVTASNTLTVLPEKDIGHKSPPTVPRMTHSSMLREFTNRERLIQKVDSEQYIPKRCQSPKIKNAVLMQLACNPNPSYLNVEKQKALRDADKMRIREYRQDLKEMMERVHSMPLLMERQSKLNAIQKMEKKFRETLHNHGLDEHFIHANSFRLQEAHHSDDDSEKFKTEQEEIETDSQSSGSEECDSRHESVHSNEHSDIISVSSSKCTSELPERDLS